MMRGLYIACSLVLFVVLHSNAQTTITFSPRYNGAALVLDTGQYVGTNDTGTHISAFRFYVSAVALYNNDELVWAEPKSYHLVDCEKPESLNLSLAAPAKPFNTVRFVLGIDSLTNVSGAMGGDLDPSLGMYWTWQSGYINLKLEGTSPRCPGRHHEFHFHLGGYSGASASAQTVSLHTNGDGNITIVADAGKLLHGTDLARQYDIMIPGKEAVSFSQKAASIFTVQ